MALGREARSPEATVVQCVGDGGFYFNNPASTFAVAKQYGLPILMLVLDNWRLVGGEGSDAANASGGRGA